MTEATNPFSLSLDPVAEAVKLGPAIREAAPEIEAGRHLPDAIVKGLREAGLFHMAVARDAGGLETNPVDLCRAIEEVSAADGSAGWCLMIAAQNGAIGGFVDRGVAAQVYGNGQIVAGVARPIGRAETQPGGDYIVSGRWPFASGSSHADWFAGECVIYDGGQARRDPDGNPISCFALIPRAQVQIHDTWYTTGLRGTASNDFSVDGVRLREEFGVQLFMDQPCSPWALYRSMPLIMVTHGAQALGVATGAVAEMVSLAQTKLAWGTDRPLREQPRMQGQIAEAVVLVESAREFLHATVRQAWDVLEAGGTPDDRLRARYRLAASHAARASAAAVDILHNAAATTGILMESPLERAFRDLHTADAHVMVSALTYEAAGRVELGLPANMAFF